ncbi:tyrosine-protein kinase hopscotch [Ceratina calcarata]|uniref:non-specific protein-tyrosine kinase n=1 Tax=Ceratina calcarata TaxID=156304 RepID=A0AAJ7NAJ1_9HYME|nr:tyrosine-protein kinase hopscotch [Ceratina calcarata]
MENDRWTIVYVANENKELTVSLGHDQTIEDLCIKVCRQLGIGPVARHLFALRNHSTKLWYPVGHTLSSKDKKFDFRLRFKPSSIQRLKHIDGNAYNYYFQQARADVMENKVPDIVYEKHKQELIGLGVSDMYRVMLEKKIPRETVESEYRKYIPKECIKRHAFFIKKPIHNALRKISGYDANYVKEQYLKQFESMAPNYPYEEYEALMHRDLQNVPLKITIRVNCEEVKYSSQSGGSPSPWTTLCLIEDLCFVSIRQDNTVEISRKNGIPSYLKFSKSSQLTSFVSALDGYYRLAVKWTFNLCGELVAPSLERLHRMKCHGPVGQEFSYSKLKEKRGDKAGAYILRESETEYNVYYLDACNKNGKLFSKRIEENLSEFVINNVEGVFSSLNQCASAFHDSEGRPYLCECLPPSEYDKSLLLLCAPESSASEVAADEEIVSSVLETGPRCVPRNQLEIPYKSFLNSVSSETTPTTSRRAIWRLAKGKKLEIALKLLKQEEEPSCTKEFLALAGKWAQLRSDSLVRLYGLTVTPVIGMLLELVRKGPLDEYLRSCPQSIKTVDMVEATACLATALWHLEENGVVHGNIRCNKLLVHAHTLNSFVVKLSDPGIFVYKDTDIHWLPPEAYNDPDSARHSFQADVWSVGTTIWQIFARGATLQEFKDASVMKRYYESGKRLPNPIDCPTEVYRLMRECWGEGNGSRKQPQAIMRDINQILYQVYNSRRSHSYATAFPKQFSSELKKQDNPENSDSSDSRSLNSESRSSSLMTENTSLQWNDTDESTHGEVTVDNCVGSTEELSAYLGWLSNGTRDTDCNDVSDIERIEHSTQLRLSHDLDEINESGGAGEDSAGNHNGSLGQMRGIYELDIDCNVILQGRIGQGFYGEVYRGTLERENGKDCEPQQVAVKKLKTKALEADIRDFEREIAIMKTLKHPNVVEILGVISEPEVCLVMEYVKHGSLQSYLTIHKQELSHKRLLGFALDIATGMDYLGSMNIVHRDLAARNILVADETKVKISDFGLAQVTGQNEYYILQTDRGLPIKWYAPESISYGKFSTRSDVWSFGVTMYETFAFGEEPQLPGLDSTACKGNRMQTNEEEIKKGNTELLAALERGTRLPCPLTCPQAIYVKLMYPCWHLESHQRPDFATLCRDIRELLAQY